MQGARLTVEFAGITTRDRQNDGHLPRAQVARVFFDMSGTYKQRHVALKLTYGPSGKFYLLRYCPGRLQCYTPDLVSEFP